MLDSWFDQLADVSLLQMIEWSVECCVSVLGCQIVLIVCYVMAGVLFTYGVIGPLINVVMDRLFGVQY